MAKKRALKLDEYNIGRNAYWELYYFCLQYPTKKRELAELRSPYTSPQITGMPRGGGRGDPTSRNAERAVELSADCEMIEQAAIEAAGQDYQYLLISVTEEVPHYYLQAVKGMRTGRDKFNSMRRRFYFLLAKSKKII